MRVILNFCRIFICCATFHTGYVTVYAQTEKIAGHPEMIFQSGFEGNSKVIEDIGTNDHGAPYEHITGKDPSFTQKNDWDLDWKSFLKKGIFQIQYTGGDATKRFAKVIEEPAKPSNHVLQFWLNDAWLASEGQQKARIQANIYGVNKGLKTFYQSVRVFLTEDFNALKTYNRQIGWCTISEFWNNEWWVKGEPFGFRITLGIGKASAQSNELNFILNAENAGQKEVWKGDNHLVKVPVGKWFTMDYYFKEGGEANGRFWMAITPDGAPREVVFDIHHFTHHTKDTAPNGITGYNPMKLYTSKELINHVKKQDKTLQIYWDDFKLWINKQPE